MTRSPDETRAGRSAPTPSYSRSAHVWLGCGVFVAMLSMVLVLPKPRGKDGFIIGDIEQALPWAGPLAIAGAVTVLVAAQQLPRSVSNEPRLSIATSVFVVITILVGLARLGWVTEDPESIAGLLCLALALAVNALAVYRAFAPPHRSSR